MLKVSLCFLVLQTSEARTQGEKRWDVKPTYVGNEDKFRVSLLTGYNQSVFCFSFKRLKMGSWEVAIGQFIAFPLIFAFL